MLPSAPLNEKSPPARRHRRHAARNRLLAAAVAAALGSWLAGCSTPVLQPTVDVPSRYAAAGPAEAEPEAAWWESFGDPVLSDLIRRAACTRCAAMRTSRFSRAARRMWSDRTGSP